MAVGELPNCATCPFRHGGHQWSHTTTEIPLRPLLAAVMANGLLSNPSLPLSVEQPARDALVNTSCLMADALLARLDEKPEAGEVKNNEK